MIISREDYFILPFYFQGSGLLEFGEFCQLAAKFLVEEDEEALKKELKEAFRIYDKEGKTKMHSQHMWSLLNSIQDILAFRGKKLASVSLPVCALCAHSKVGKRKRARKSPNQKHFYLP